MFLILSDITTVCLVAFSKLSCLPLAIFRGFYSVDFCVFFVVYFLMFFFLVSLIPCALLFYHIHMPCAKQQLVSILSFFGGVVFCVVSALFGNSFRLVPSGFFGNFLCLFLTESLIPAAIVCLVFFVWAKDSLEYRISSLFPLLAAFFSVYLPFRVVFCSQETGFFGLFFKPVLFLFMVAGISAAVFLLYRAICDKRKIYVSVLYALLGVLLLVLPAVSEAVWCDAGSTLVWLGCVFVCVLGSSFLIFNSICLLKHKGIVAS